MKVKNTIHYVINKIFALENSHDLYPHICNWLQIIQNKLEDMLSTQYSLNKYLLKEWFFAYCEYPKSHSNINKMVIFIDF